MKTQCTCPRVLLAPGCTAAMFDAACPTHGKVAKSTSHADRQELIDDICGEIESDRPGSSWFDDTESLPLDDPMVKMCDSNREA